MTESDYHQLFVVTINFGNCAKLWFMRGYINENDDIATER